MLDPVTMTDLGEQLRSAEGEAVRADIVARFEALSASIARTLSTGVAGSEFSRLQTIDLAAKTARQIVADYR